MTTYTYRIIGMPYLPPFRAVGSPCPEGEDLPEALQEAMRIMHGRHYESLKSLELVSDSECPEELAQEAFSVVANADWRIERRRQYHLESNNTKK